MLVSNFELLVKRIAPVSGINAVDAPFRRVVQGYFLTVTNLDPSRATSFFLTCTIPTVSGANNPLEKEFVLGPPATANVVCLADTANTDNVGRTISLFVSNASHKKFRTDSFAVAPLQTVLVVLLPNIGANAGLLQNATMEVRGFIEISQSRQFFFDRPPIDVLITPETRGTFLDNDYPNFGPVQELDFDQIAYALPTFSGASKNTVELAPRIPLPRFPLPPLPPLNPGGIGFRSAAPEEEVSEMNVETALLDLQNELRLLGFKMEAEK